MCKFSGNSLGAALWLALRKSLPPRTVAQLSRDVQEDEEEDEEEDDDEEEDEEEEGRS